MPSITLPNGTLLDGYSAAEAIELIRAFSPPATIAGIEPVSAQPAKIEMTGLSAESRALVAEAREACRTGGTTIPISMRPYEQHELNENGRRLHSVIRARHDCVAELLADLPAEGDRVVAKYEIGDGLAQKIKNGSLVGPGFSAYSRAMSAKRDSDSSYAYTEIVAYRTAS